MPIICWATVFRCAFSSIKSLIRHLHHCHFQRRIQILELVSGLHWRSSVQNEIVKSGKQNLSFFCFLRKKFIFAEDLINNDTKYKYNMASVVGSSYVSQELIAILVFFKNISKWACSCKEQVFLILVEWIWIIIFGGGKATFYNREERKCHCFKLKGKTAHRITVSRFFLGASPKHIWQKRIINIKQTKWEN